MIHKIHSHQVILNRDLDEMFESDIRDLGEECFRQRNQQVQRPWGVISLIYLRDNKKANVMRKEKVRKVGKDQIT